MKHLIGIFVLSKSEQRMIVIIVLALVAAALVRHQQYAQHLPPDPTPATAAEPSASPPELRNDQ